MPALRQALMDAEADALAAELDASGRLHLELDGETVELSAEEVEVRLRERPGVATHGDRDLLVALDAELDPELVAEGLAREVVHRVQSARKDADLDYSDRIRVLFRADGELEEAIRTHRDWIASETLAIEITTAQDTELAAAPVEGHDFALRIDRARV
jgi:isoleucyl-tRNA synthetase